MSIGFSYISQWVPAYVLRHIVAARSFSASIRGGSYKHRGLGADEMKLLAALGLSTH